MNTVVQKPIPAHMKEKYDHYRAIMLEKIAELDDALMDKYLTDPESLQPAELRAALRKGTIAFKAHPLFCGSAYKYAGVQVMLDGVIDYLPSPVDMPAATGTAPKDKEKVEVRPRQPDEPFCGLAFKIVDDKFGTLTYVRVYSGTLVKGTRVLNANKNTRENISRMFQMSADDRIPIESAESGDIIAVIGIDEANTGDTLCDAGPSDHPRTAQLPRAGHQHVDRAQERGRQAEDGRRLDQTPPAGPDVPHQLQRRDRRDRHCRHG